MAKKYYSQRQSGKGLSNYDLNTLKSLFRNVFSRLEDICYFQEAMGYLCTSGNVYGYLGKNVAEEILFETGFENIWPVYQYIDYYGEEELFTVIEYLFDHVSSPIDMYFHEWNQCGNHATQFNKEKGQEDYKQEINRILKRYDGGFYLSDNGEVRKSSPTGLEQLVEKVISTTDIENIDKKVEYSISKFTHFNSTIEEKKDAIRTLADVMEYYKKSGITLDSKDDSDLFQIANNFSIRHHNKMKNEDYDKEIWYNWIFYTYLASIHMLVGLSG